MNLSKLRGSVPDNILDEVYEVSNKFGINTSLRMAHFLSQVAHESGNFKFVTENLNYSAQGLKKTFSKYFKQPGLAEAYARKPELIASRVYANRMGNNGEGSRDGWKFRGRGYLQLTGKDIYERFNEFVEDDVVTNPELVATKYPLLSAAWFFHTNNINKVSDRGATNDTVRRVTRVVNGGYNGLEDRQRYFKKYYDLLDDNEPVVHSRSEFADI